MNDLMEIKRIAKNVRRNVLDMTFQSGTNGGHIGGAFSSADILAVLYGRILNISPETVMDENRDRFLLSKGHTAIGHYAVLAECGFISHEEMMSFEKPSSRFSTHEMMDLEKGIEISGGSLGYGLSIGVGIALNAKKSKKSYKTYVLIGDGECNEGTVWESAMAASRFHLDNLIAIVDANGQSLDGYTSDIMPVDNFEKVWEGFGWNVIAVDGNNLEDLLNAFSSLSDKKPNAVIARTVKCRGIPSIEGQVGWHHARISEEDYNALKEELEAAV